MGLEYVPATSRAILVQEAKSKITRVRASMYILFPIPIFFLNGIFHFQIRPQGDQVRQVKVIQYVTRIQIKIIRRTEILRMMKKLTQTQKNHYGFHLGAPAVSIPAKLVSRKVNIPFKGSAHKAVDAPA